MSGILVVEDEAVLAGNIVESLEERGSRAISVPSAEEALDVLNRQEPDLILLDLRLPGQDGLEFLRQIKSEGFGGEVIIMTAHGDIETAVKAIKLGASDFITKSGRLAEMHHVVERVLRERRLASNLSYFKNKEKREGGIDRLIGESASMLQLKESIMRLATSQVLSRPSPPTVLITGATGTGKDVAARAIHFEGPRRDQPFVDVNCTAIPSELFESELFGHVRGAFTDAKSNKQGLFEIANGGTLFLDEIGHLTLATQAKLLTAIERHEFRRVGGTSPIHVDVHVMAATNRDLEAACNQGQFRTDLYHRLRFVHFDMPNLADREADIELLAVHMLRRANSRLGVNIAGLTDRALAVLGEYEWPGNVRELSHMLESAAIMATGSRITEQDLPISAKEEGGFEVRIDSENCVVMNFAEGTPTLEQVEARVIEAALLYCRHNVSRTARVLGVSRDTLRYRLQKLSIS